MKTHAVLLSLGVVVLLAASLFNYSRAVATEHGTTSWSFDGGGIAIVALWIGLFFACRQIGRATRLALSRAGLSSELKMPGLCQAVFILALPFQVFGYGGTSRDLFGAETKFDFGLSPEKTAVFILAILVVWLVTLGRRLRELANRLPTEVSR